MINAETDRKEQKTSTTQKHVENWHQVAESIIIFMSVLGCKSELKSHPYPSIYQQQTDT